MTTYRVKPSLPDIPYRTDPNHKASFSIGVQCSCSCGWKSSVWWNEGAKTAASSEWRAHREKVQCSGWAN